MAVKKDRGTFLSLVIVSAIFLSIWSLYYNIDPTLLVETYQNNPEWLLPYNFISNLIGIGLFIAIWLWKKWAVYSLLGYGIVTLFIDFALLRINSDAAGAFFAICLAIGGLIFWAIYRKWENFS